MTEHNLNALKNMLGQMESYSKAAHETAERLGAIRYWVSWWTTEKMGAFELKHQSWVSGHTYDDDLKEKESVCAVIMVPYGECVLQVVRDAYETDPEFIDWRFVVAKYPNWEPEPSRFPKRADKKQENKNDER